MKTNKKKLKAKYYDLVEKKLERNFGNFISNFENIKIVKENEERLIFLLNSQRYLINKKLQILAQW